MGKVSAVIANKVKETFWYSIAPPPSPPTLYYRKWFTNVHREPGLETPKEEVWSVSNTIKSSK